VSGGERVTLWAMIALGLLGWLVAIAFLQTWGIIAGAIVVAWSAFWLLTTKPRPEPPEPRGHSYLRHLLPGGDDPDDLTLIRPWWSKRPPRP
jgi:hypothetical protein